MKSRAARLALLILFVVALGVTAYLFRTSGAAARTESAAAASFSDGVQRAAHRVLEIRAAQQAYVAAGQGGDFWTGKVTERVTVVRDSLAALRTTASSAQAETEIDSAVATLQDFVQMDGRARDYVNSKQSLLASDLIFSNGIELTDAVLASLDRAKAAEVQARSTAESTFERRQMFALAAAAAAAVLVVLLLLPRVDLELSPALLTSRSASSYSPLAVSRGSVDVHSDGWSSARRLTDVTETSSISLVEPVPSEPEPPPPAAEETPAEAAVPVEAQTVPAPPPVPAPPQIDLRGIAALCTQLSRVEDTLALPPLLERAAALLDAAGIILWIADPDGRELSPIIAQGYPPQLISRLGPIPRDAQNATAAAFRTSLLQTVNADAVSNGAIAAPLVTSGGCVGVMAAEVRGVGEKQEAKLAAAVIVAAQLASLVGPPASRSESAVEAANATSVHA
jgi:hypothetical protein